MLLSTMFLLFSVTAVSLMVGSTVATHPFRLLFAILFLIAAAAIAARPIVYVLTGRTGTLLFPDHRSGKPPPAYSTAEACRIKGDFVQALQLYEEIVTSHPKELRAYVAIIEIALENVNDAALAKKTLDRGLAAISTENGRRYLQETYDEGMVCRGNS